jgi:hypothetical protein
MIEARALTTETVDHERRLGFAINAAFVVAILLAATSLGGVLAPSLYARETASWTIQAVAQDWFDLVIVVPLLFAVAMWASTGSRRGGLALAGLLLYAVYTLLIYAFAVHLNALFLLYCAGLGVALFALIALGRAFLHDPPTQIAAPIPRRLAGGYLIAIGVVFGVLWLLQLVPAAITGKVPAELAETGLFTNPVHVIDLSFILPLHVIGGLVLLRRRPIALVLAPVLLAFGAVMSASIGFLVGLAAGPLPLVIAMAASSLGAIGLLVRLLRSLR